MEQNVSSFLALWVILNKYKILRNFVFFYFRHRAALSEGYRDYPDFGKSAPTRLFQ